LACVADFRFRFRRSRKIRKKWSDDSKPKKERKMLPAGTAPWHGGRKGGVRVEVFGARFAAGRKYRQGKARGVERV